MTESGASEAKRPATVLAGPHGHPFHPILVTVPIGAWVASLVFDVASRFVTDATALALGARWLVAIGVLGALAAAVIGFLDFIVIPSGTAARTTAVTHMALNLGVTTAFVVSFFLRDGAAPTDVPVIALSLVALAALAVSGWLGGKLTYRYGVRVVDEATQQEGYRRR